MTRHRVNFAPEDWTPRTGAESRRSILLTGGVGLWLLLLGIWVGRSPPIPEVAAQTLPPTLADPSRCRVSTDDPVSASVWRASNWYPWHEVLQRLLAELDDGSRLQQVRYDGKGTLEVSGEVVSFSELPPLMLELGELPFLADPDPHKADNNPKTGRIDFVLRLKVVSLLPCESETQ
ncbi:MAG: hypothetical protein AB7O52_02170 [Planctomycetota bacterium]